MIKTSRSNRSKGRIIASLILTLSILLACSCAALGATHGHSKRTVTYTVQAGDTLWSIADKFDPTQDTRKVVYEMEQMNHISDRTALVVPGESLKIPVH